VYDSSNPTISAFHRFGWSETLTLGANIQKDKQQSVFGGEALLSTTAGFFKFEPGLSSFSGSTGGALRSTYVYSDFKKETKAQRNFNLSLFGGSPNFLQFGSSLLGAAQKLYEVSAGYSQGFGRTVSGNLSGSYRYFDTLNGKENSFTINVGGTKRFENGISLNGSVTHTKAQSGQEDLGVFAFLLWSFPKEKQVVTATHNTVDASTRADWSYTPSTGADSASYKIGLRDGQAEQGYSGELLYDGNRARTSISHEVILTKQKDASGVANGQKTSNQVTTILLGTSLAYAGGHFAIGRPVTDSFAIIAPVYNLRGKRVDINANGDDSYLAKTDFLGPALAPELSAYGVSSITVSGRNLPPDVTIPKDHFSLYPTYKSGFAYEIGTDANVYISAVFLESNGTPLSLAAGLATYLDDSAAEPVTIFTNKKGLVRSEGFKPGRYRIDIATDVYEPIEITIPKEATDSYDLGTIKLKAK
jgi:outer membrane usher protein